MYAEEYLVSVAVIQKNLILFKYSGFDRFVRCEVVGRLLEPILASAQAPVD